MKTGLGLKLPRLAAVVALGAVCLLASFAWADWNPGQPYKWAQQPDVSPTGIDINATQPYIGADDFVCTTTGPITDIHVWGSWFRDVLPGGSANNVSFVLSIHSDIPGTATSYSRPGQVLWSRLFPPGSFVSRTYATGPEGWYTPQSQYLPQSDYVCWQYNFYLSDTEFVQQGTAANPVVYWLDVQAIPQATGALFGWKTSLEHWNDDAVWGQGQEPYTGPWFDLHYPPGHIMYPQSMDHAFVITGRSQPQSIDWGDAPDPTYPTLAASLGASHVIVPGMMLGTLIDAEPDGQPNATATGDDIAGVDDEDGVVFTSPLVPGRTATVEVTASIAGMLDAWIDFNRDGDWADAGEQIFASQPLVAGLNSLTFTVPAGAVSGNTFSRFRYSSAGGLSYTGPAPDGEVEDYQVPIWCYKWEQPPDLSTTGFDVNATNPYILADDFQCDMPGPITDIHVWGSWYHDILPLQDPNQVVFTLSLHRDIPAGPTTYSMPGALVWSRTFGPGQFTVRPYQRDLREGWLTPPELYQPFADTICWRYDFYLNPGELYQQGTPSQPVVYWLDVQAQPLSSDARFGWKTSIRHWNDDAVWGQGKEPYAGPWGELRYPPNHPKYGQSADLAFAITGNCWQPQELDWGDAPDPTYPTLAASLGASHVIVPGMMLGTLIDAEPDGQPNATATGDDIAGVDDEDGVVFTSPLVPGRAATVEVTASIAGMLDAWIDFNRDGDWADAGEQIFASQPLAAGLNSLTFTVPASAVSGNTFSRFRYSSAGGLSYTGPAPDGEVEDYQVAIWCYKWEQPPDLSYYGFDVNATKQYILADDFQCNMPGPITDIHVWGSWYHDILPLGDPNQVVFTLSLHSDIPKTPTTYSRPGGTLWSRTFGPGQFTVRPYRQDLTEGWLTPPDALEYNADHVCWRYDFYLDPAEFYQQGTPTQPIVYWLDVQAQPLETAGTARFGWKTSTRHWNDDAVWGQGNEPYPGPWSELRYPSGHPQYPQSVDLAFAITGGCWQTQELDWGDAPDPSYPTLAANNGARHVIVPGMFLGALIDAEADGQPNATATGDDIAGVDDEDGVVFTSPLVPGAPATVTVTASVPGMLDAWIDFNADGDWADPGEQIFAVQPLVAGANTLTFIVPISAGATGAYTTSFARFRYSSAGGLSYTGPAPDGEVEDYMIRIYPRPVIVNKGKAKCLLLGSYVLIKKDVVTANFGQFWYFEEPLRFAALGVLPQPSSPASTWSPGDLVSCYGYTVMSMSGCELMLQELYSWLEGSGIVRPLGQNNRDSGGGVFCNQPGLMNDVRTGAPAVGLNSVAMLVTLWGRCTCILSDPTGAQTDFWADDGSGLWDGLCESTGVKVRIPPNYAGAIALRKYYAITGIMRTYTTPSGQCVRYLWPRNTADIVPVAEP